MLVVVVVIVAVVKAKIVFVKKNIFKKEASRNRISLVRLQLNKSVVQIFTFSGNHFHTIPMAILVIFLHSFFEVFLKFTKTVGVGP